jgi:hypothetical protein
VFGIVVGTIAGLAPFVEEHTRGEYHLSLGTSTNTVGDGTGGGGTKRSTFRNINIIKDTRSGTGIDLARAVLLSPEDPVRPGRGGAGRGGGGGRLTGGPDGQGRQC